MKINAEKFIDNIKKYVVPETVYLVSGNESGLISSIEKLIISNLNSGQDNEIITVDKKNDKNLDFANIAMSQSLFKTKNIIIIKNPDNVIFDSLEKLDIKNNTIILRADNIKNTSKIKKYFDNHKSFFSISCYKLSANFKKKIIDQFINNKKLTLTKESYWFLVENTSDEFQLLQNDLDKIYSFGKSSVSVEELRKIISNTNTSEMDELFFHCFTLKKDMILSKTSKTIHSVNDAFVFLQAFKRLTKILVLAIEEKSNKNMEGLTNYFLPKYLFRQKENFKIILQKSNLKKISQIYLLMQKTELYLRKNDGHFLIIIQRFLLNCSNSLK